MTIENHAGHMIAFPNKDIAEYKKENEQMTWRITQLESQLEQAKKYETCAKEWAEKTEWIQNFDFPAKYLGWHRADVVRDMLEQTQKKIAVLEAENGIFQVMYDSVRESEKKLKAELEAQLLKTRLSEAKTTSPIPSDFELYSAPVFITKLEAQTQDSKEATPAQPIEPASHIGDSNEMVQPTDISKQLREYAADSGYSHNDYADTMLAAASEIERYYGGMLAWKKTAETKDRKLSQEIESRISERWAARLGASQAQQPAQEPTEKDVAESITLLSAVIDAWENGIDCYDDFDGVSGSFIGKAFNLDDEIFKRCCSLLNRINPPRNVSQQPAQEPLFNPNLFELATLILSDCGISENNQRLYDRVLERLIKATDKPQEPVAWISNDAELPLKEDGKYWLYTERNTPHLIPLYINAEVLKAQGLI